MHYNFYFDESFHDRAVTLSPDGVLNVIDSNKNDSYIGVFWGCSNTKASKALKLLLNFEERQRQSFGLAKEKELKSTNISKEHFTYGVKSFRDKTHYFYRDLFETMLNIEPIIQIETISKVEFYVRELFKGTDFPAWVKTDSFYYTLTKFLLIYGNKELFKKLYLVNCKKSAKEFKDLLLSQIKQLLEAIDGIKRKTKEEIAYEEVCIILESVEIMIDTCNKYAFNYSPNFYGLIRLLDEIKISSKKVNLTIDKEEKTFMTAQKFPFHTIKQQESINSVQLRFSDWISGFIGRMMYALSNDEKMQEDEVLEFSKIKDNDLTTKRILSEKWFDLTQKDFELYQLIYNALIVKHQYHWTTMTMSYCDQTILFYALLRYLASYKTYDEFCKVTKEMHSEYYNSCCCEELLQHYKTI